MTEESRSTQQLIGALADELRAVRPLLPPLWRAAGWLGVVTALAAVPIWLLGDLADARARLADARFQLEWAATLLTGVLALLASFHLSVPGRGRWWIWAPLPPLLLWLVCSGLGCLRNGPGSVDYDCLMMIVGISLPLSLLLWPLLRRSHPLAPLPVALTAALAVAAISAFILQFFHPFAVTLLDLAVHILALATVLLIGASFGRRSLAAA